jgi:hypothetical protein
MSNPLSKRLTPVIEKGISVPDSRKDREKEKSTRVNWPFLNMEHGDSFLLPQGCDKQKAYSALSAMKRRNQIDKNTSVVVRQENDGIRVWLVKETK